MEDNVGQDEKILAVPSHKLTKRYDNINECFDFKWAKIGDMHGAVDAKQLIVDAIEREKKSMRNPARARIDSGKLTTRSRH
jgi:inorganic pyrophosphatase